MVTFRDDDAGDDSAGYSSSSGYGHGEGDCFTAIFKRYRVDLSYDPSFLSFSLSMHRLNGQ